MSGLPELRTFRPIASWPLCAKTELVHCSEQTLLDHLIGDSEHPKGAMVRLSAFAVFTFMTSSNFVD